MRKIAYYIAKKFTDYNSVKDENDKLKADIRNLVMKENEILGVQTKIIWLLRFQEDDALMFGESSDKLKGIKSIKHHGQ